MSDTTRKNILFLASWYPNRVIPGNGVFIKKHAEAVALTHNVYVLHIISDPDCKQNIEVTTNTEGGIISYIAYLKPCSNKLVKLFRYWKAYRFIKQKLPKIEINHVNVTYPIGLIALLEKWTLGRPYIISEHWTDYQKPMSDSISNLQKKATQLLVKNATFVCPVSKHLCDAMLDFGLKGNYYPIPNIVDTNTFKPSKNSSTDFRIVHISNMLNSHKNVSGILRVFKSILKQIPESKITLVGNKSVAYNKEADELGILPSMIDYIDFCNTKEISHQIQQSDVFVLFSNYENLPCVILEAFACGVPVISSDVGGIHEYFPEDFGCLVPARDEASLEKAILEFYTSKSHASPEKMHAYAEEHFSPKAINRTFNKIYEQTIVSNS
ncbi:MAG: glycosyltransferase [Flavicella sp.]